MILILFGGLRRQTLRDFLTSWPVLGFRGRVFQKGKKNMLGTVIEIDGDYAVVRYDVTGTESHVALAILGDAEIGDKVLFENFSYELIRQ